MNLSKQSSRFVPRPKIGTRWLLASGEKPSDIYSVYVQGVTWDPYVNQWLIGVVVSGGHEYWYDTDFFWGRVSNYKRYFLIKKEIPQPENGTYWAWKPRERHRCRVIQVLGTFWNNESWIVSLRRNEEDPTLENAILIGLSEFWESAHFIQPEPGPLVKG